MYFSQASRPFRRAGERLLWCFFAILVSQGIVLETNAAYDWSEDIPHL